MATLNLNLNNVKTGFHDKYSYIKPIDCGRYGVVHLAERKDKTFFSPYDKVAVKELPTYRHDIKHYNNVQMITNEVTNLRKFKGCDHIVRLLDVYQDDSKFYLVQENCDNNKVKNYLKQNNDVNNISRLIAHTTNGLSQIHDNAICHSDIKPSNIMYSTIDNQYKICDFGSSFAANRVSGSTSMKGTPFFFSIEKFSGNYGYSSDVWAIGVLTYLLIFKAHPYMKKKDLPLNITPHDIYTTICSNNIIWHQDTSLVDDINTHNALDFIKCTLQKDETKRISAKEAIWHPFLKNHTIFLSSSADI